MWITFWIFVRFSFLCFFSRPSPNHFLPSSLASTFMVMMMCKVLGKLKMYFTCDNVDMSWLCNTKEMFVSQSRKVIKNMSTHTHRAENIHKRHWWTFNYETYCATWSITGIFFWCGCDDARRSLFVAGWKEEKKTPTETLAQRSKKNFFRVAGGGLQMKNDKHVRVMTVSHGKLFTFFISV